MRAFVHFSVGVSGMLILLMFLDLSDRKEFLLMFASGFWALIPDLGWLLLRLGVSDLATLWKTVFNSAVGLVFWLHPVLDAIEPENRVYEMTGGFALLGIAVLIYFFANDWDEKRAHRPTT